MVSAVATESLERDLRRAVSGEVRFDSGTLGAYAHDGSLYRQVPIGVVLPRSIDDIVATVDVCRRHDAPLLSRGCGTSLAGQCVNHAMVIDFSKYLNRILDVDVKKRTARVQPGLIRDHLANAVARHGLTYGPDPATHDHCTLGGMVGNNSCGTHSIVWGKTADTVESLDVLLYDGTRMQVGRTDDRELRRIVDRGDRRGEIYAALRDIRDRYGDAVRTGFPNIPRRVSGYNLDWLLPEQGFNVGAALTGSESTLVTVLEATVKLDEDLPERAIIVVGYPDVPTAAYAVPELLRSQPMALEGFDREVVARLDAKGLHKAGEELLPPGDMWLILEFGSHDRSEVERKAHEVLAALEAGGAHRGVKLFDDPKEEQMVWEVRRNGVGSGRVPGSHGAWPNWEDAAVAPEQLGDYLTGYLELCKRHKANPTIFGHFGQGCIHSRVDFRLRSVDGVRDFRAFMEEAADLVVSHGGSLSGEHGDGHGRAELWPKMFSPELMRAFWEFKRIWDPTNRMNPGKLVNAYRMDEHLVEHPGLRSIEVTTHFQFPEDGGSFFEAAGRCFGVGKCRHTEGGVMCPSFMATREEQHSTRGRARLLFEMMSTAGPVSNPWRSEEVKEALDLCLACKGCKSDCPVRVDMATYKAEFLSHYWKRRLRPRAAYAFGLIDRWARIGSRTPRLANFATHAPVLARLSKLVAGADRHRHIPRFAHRTFRAWFEARAASEQTQDGPRVILWPDTFNNHFRPDTAIAALEVLENAGFRVDIPRQQLCCGRPLYDYGMLPTAKRYLRSILDALHEDIVAGVPVVGLEPSCVAVFRDELVNLLPLDEDAQRLKEQTFTLAELLERKAPHWTPPRMHGHALVQPHCHHHAVMGFDSDEKLLRDTGLEIALPDAGCCGMAGSFGYEAGEKYEVSMRAGERALLPAVRNAPRDVHIVADGFSCRSQIEGATRRTTLHIAELLAAGLHQDQSKAALAGRRWWRRRVRTHAGV
jgi:FAD/FMN-containing dehydrogenase